MRTTHHGQHSFAQNADHFAHNSPFPAFFAEVVCTLGTTPPRTAISPSPNGGFSRHEDPTRRAKLAARTARGRAAVHGHTKQPAPEEETLGNLFHRGHAYEEAFLAHVETDASHGARPFPFDAGHGADPQGRVLDAVPDLEREHRLVVGGLSGGGHAHAGHLAHAGRLGGRAPAPRPEGARVGIAPRVVPIGSARAPVGT